MKPRIALQCGVWRVACGVWLCVSHISGFGLLVGNGDSPAEAYSTWQQRAQFVARAMHHTPRIY